MTINATVTLLLDDDQSFVESFMFRFGGDTQFLAFNQPQAALDYLTKEQEAGSQPAVSVVVVDYDMPGMTGLDFCRSISHLPVRRIMLTGKTDESLAAKACNEGLVHNFFIKQDEAVTAKLKAAIHKENEIYLENKLSA